MNIKNILYKLVYKKKENQRLSIYNYAEPLRLDSSLKILALSDFHYAKDEELDILKSLSPNDYDIVILLGDIRYNFLSFINKYLDKEKYGVIGNHDSNGLLEKYGINNIHGKLVQIGNLRIVGFQGSNKYKDEGSPCFTQQESLDICKKLPKADILISHDSGYHLYREDNDVYIGLKGISEYLYRNQVPLNLHGHHHTNSINILNNGTTAICVYRAAIISLKDYSVKTLF